MRVTLTLESMSIGSDSHFTKQSVHLLEGEKSYRMTEEQGSISGNKELLQQFSQSYYQTSIENTHFKGNCWHR